ncbi:MAG: pilin [Candidatus Saccharimonadales bacterium]
MKRILILMGLITAVAMTAPIATPVAAYDAFPQCQVTSDNTVCKAKNEDTAATATTKAKTLINTMLYILGMVAVVMIVFGGIRYAKSTGDASKVKQAKDTIVYSVAGLAVALLAFSIVNFVLAQFK